MQQVKVKLLITTHLKWT